jgi:hypothetical protein
MPVQRSPALGEIVVAVSLVAWQEEDHVIAIAIAVAMLVGVVALNALSVSRWVRGSTESTLDHASQRFSEVEASRQASLVRVRKRSRAPCLYMRVAQIDVSV